MKLPKIGEIYEGYQLLNNYRVKIIEVNKQTHTITIINLKNGCKAICPFIHWDVLHLVKEKKC